MHDPESLLYAVAILLIICTGTNTSLQQPHSSTTPYRKGDAFRRQAGNTPVSSTPHFTPVHSTSLLCTPPRYLSGDCASPPPPPPPLHPHRSLLSTRHFLPILILLARDSQSEEFTVKTPKMSPSCSLPLSYEASNIPGIVCACTWLIPGTCYLTCTQRVLNLYVTCTQHVMNLYLTCT